MKIILPAPLHDDGRGRDGGDGHGHGGGGDDVHVHVLPHRHDSLLDLAYLLMYR